LHPELTFRPTAVNVMTRDHQFLPEVFADGVVDLHLESGVFRITLGQFVPQQQSPNDPPTKLLVPKATLLLTELGFTSLCDVIEHVRSEVAKRQQEETGSSPNFE
jgi:hypothetical protein